MCGPELLLIAYDSQIKEPFMHYIKYGFAKTALITQEQNRPTYAL